MWRRPAPLVGRICRLGMGRVRVMDSGYASVAGSRFIRLATEKPDPFAKPENPMEGAIRMKLQSRVVDSERQVPSLRPGKDHVGAQKNFSGDYISKKEGFKDDGGARKHLSGSYVSKKERFKLLVSTIRHLKDSKEDVYGALDACVAWKQSFPIGWLNTALFFLQKEQQWHKIIQVIKWILSKGQGNTYGIYKQLIQALDMDNRAEEAQMFWLKKIGAELHSVPWGLCQVIMSVYYRNNMPNNLVKLFEGLESVNRIAPDKTIVQQVADSYEMLGSLDEKTEVLEKYSYLFTDNGCHKEHKVGLFKKKKKSGRREPPSTSDGLANDVSSSGSSFLLA